MSSLLWCSKCEVVFSHLEGLRLCSASNTGNLSRVCGLSEFVCNARLVKVLARYVMLRVRWQTVCDALVCDVVCLRAKKVIFVKEALLCQECLVLTVCVDWRTEI